MKVVQFIASKGWGGAEDSFIELCNMLAQEIQIEVVLFRENQIEEKLDKKITVHRISSHSSRYNPFLYIELIHLFGKIKPDIVHTHSAKASEIIYRLSTWYPLTQVATKRNPRKAKIFNQIEHVVAISKDVANSISGVNPKIIYNGLLKKVLPVLGIRKDDIFTISAIGRLDKVKGFDRLVREVSKLKIPYKLQIVGEGTEREHLEKIAMENGITDAIEFLGFREDIPSIIASSDLVIITSISEGFGRVVVETLFYGKLLVSTKVGVAAEILPEALLIKENRIAEKIRDIYRHRGRYEDIFKSVQQAYVKAFSIEEKAEEYKIYYHNVMKDTKRK
jgi:glycosyltransferase involved in cell wall biosynthesis